MRGDTDQGEYLVKEVVPQYNTYMLESGGQLETLETNR